MKRIYLFLLSVLVSIGVSARLVYYDNKYVIDEDTNKFTETPWVHTYTDANKYDKWTDSNTKMTPLGSEGYVYKVEADAARDVIFHVGQTETGSSAIADGQAYSQYGATYHAQAVWVLHGQVKGTDTWEDIARFTYNNDNTYSTGEIYFSKDYSQVCVKCFMFGADFTDSFKRGELRFASDITGEGTFEGKSDNELHAMNLGGGTYSFTLDFNGLPSAISLKVEDKNGSFPQTLYMGIDAYDFGEWTFNHEGTRNGDVTTFRVLFPGSSGSFIFTTMKGDATDRDSYAGKKWGADGFVYIDNPDGITPYPVVRNDDEIFGIGGGVYDIMVNHSTGTLTVKAVTDALPKPLYLGVDAKDNGNWKFNITGTYADNMTEYEVDIFASPAYFTFTNVKGDETDFDANRPNMWGPSANEYDIYDYQTELIVRKESCFKLLSGPGKYKITVDHNYGTVFVERTGSVRIPSGYYLYGDMNRWSCLANAGMTITGTGSDIDFIYADPASIWGADAPNQKFLSEDEIKEYWQFYSCDELPEALKSTGGTWYVLDFTNLSDDMGNTGRLCGQFKITRGQTSQAVETEDDYQWGMKGAGANANYIVNCAIPVNYLYGVHQGTGLGNLHLNSSYVDKAKLYFNPDTKQIYITGTPENIYAYYSVANSTEFNAPEKAQFSDLSQRLYYVNTDSWNSATPGDYNPAGIYDWEEVTDINELAGAGINTGVYTKAYRKLLPLGGAHRFPVEFNATISRSDGTMFPAQRVRCADLLFLEAKPVNIYFRYEDDHLPAWVRINAYLENYNADGMVTGRTYFASRSANNSKWLATERVTETAPGETVAHDWFMTRTPISGDFVSGSYALFQTAEPLSYPRGGIYAQGTDRTETQIKGENLWYVVPCGHDRSNNIEILYSHLKGTYQIGAGSKANDFQINAELFSESGELDTTFHGDVTYSFEVFKTQAGGGSPQKIWSRTFDEGKPEHGDNSKYAPYFNIPAGEIANHGAGWYQVKVEVRKGDKTYTAYDVYPVFPADN